MKSLAVLLVLAIAAHFTLSAPAATAESGKKVICYYGTWAVYRPGNGKFDVENIDPFICTHIVYAFAKLSETDNTIQAYDPYNDVYDNWGRGGFLRFTGLKQKNPALKTLLAIGGWNEGSTKYSQMVADPSKRATFVNSVVNFLRTYNFDGLDFDWEYPGSRGGVPADKVNFISVIRELKTAFAPYGYMLTAAVSPGKDAIDAGYDISTMASILDQIHIMGYDYHGAWETYTGLNAPLYSNPYEDFGNNKLLNVNWTVQYYISNGTPPSKLILGMPLYGRGFTLASTSSTGFYSYAPQPITAGPYTRENGFWGYNEICEKMGSDPGWNVVRDPYYQSPYAHKGNQWIGYEDANSLALKAQYAINHGLGGAMVWSVETDDFLAKCGSEKFPLIKSIVRTLNGGSIPSTVSPSPTTAASSTTAVVSSSTNKSTPLVITSSTTVSRITTTSGSFTCQQDGLFANPSDCGTYFQCVRNGQSFTLYKRSCGRGTVFSQELISCAHPYQVSGCENYVPPSI